MKKILAMILAMLLVLSMTAAFAATFTPELPEGAQLDKPITFNKAYSITGTSPDITFTFTAPTLIKFVDREGTTAYEEGSEAAAPTAPTVTISNTDAAFTAANGKNTGNQTQPVTVSVDVGNAEPGIYTYKFKEENSSVSGVTYYSGDIFVVVTVLLDDDGETHYVTAFHKGSLTEEKTDTIDNSYASSGLKVTKTVSGNMADRSKYFKFEIALTAPEGTTIDHGAIAIDVNGTPKAAAETITGGEGYQLSGDTYTIYLKHGDTVTLSNLPVGVTYVVTEYPEAYTSNKTDDKVEGEISTTVAEEAFDNELTAEVDTGITLEKLPYILVMALVLAGAALMIIRRRRNNED